jgi:hypothetical protein
VDLHGDTRWRELCRVAAQEQDSDKLLELVSQINNALDELTRSPAREHNNDAGAF